ncbi:hypothetical protein NW755_012550 [Fusarium falciforme]|uniref:Uncharacterized protein n=1 Tax=Fusarium falciforme TaxID=195108 RepID=A0A9W8QUC5_9HYPO|nr:hypothetical protein NW755_012550 [Fusarium falciforme]
MDGTYNNPYAQAQSPLSPQTPSAGAYQVNVSRQKTRKWVQAPVQNYDGDDWGADEFEDDEPPPPPPVPRVTTGLRPVGQRSESYGPSPMLAAAVASSSQSSSGPPSLHIQTQQNASPSTAAPARGPEQVHNAAALGAGRTGSPAPASSGAGSSKAPSYHQPDVRSSTPQSTASSGARASPAIRPSELYRHVDEDRRLGGSPLSIAEAIAAKPSDRATPPLNEPNRQNYNQGDGPGNQPIQKQPTFDSILAKREDSGFAQRSFDNAPVAESRPLYEETHDDKEEPVIHPAAGIDRKRMSVSPQLPSMLRMSGFGDDFFSSSSSVPPSAPLDPVKQEQPPAPAPVAPAPPSQSDKSSSHEVSTIDEAPKENTNSPRVAVISQNPALAPANDPRAIPPLRTPSPHTKSLEVAALSGSPQSTLPEITPTEPLKPRVPEYSPSDYEPQSAQTQQTTSTFNASPVKESDMLSEEIMKSLSPIGQSSALAPPPDNSQSLTPGNRNDTRNSSYTLSGYDDYWADTTEKPAQEANNEVKDHEKPQPVPAPAAAPLPLPSPVPEQKALGSGSSSPAPPPAEDNTEPDSLGLRRKFSWEADFGPSPNLFKSESPAEASSKNEAPTVNSPSPLVVSAIQAPRDATPEPAGPSRSSPGAVETPMIVVPPSGGISHQVSKASTLPPTQQPVVLEPPSPISVRTDESTPHGLDRVGTGVEDKVLIPTPSTITASATPPPEKPQPQTLVLPPSEFPQTIPFRDIMNLSTPLQRTLKFDAGRATYAAWESGLENWLSNLMTQQPEYAHATGSFSGAGLPGSSQGGHASTPSGSHSQQPYYQQYLNASSPTTTAPAAGRSRLGGLPLSAPSGSSSFGNSGNQLGTKSKEFMHSAGKMGKGLFSKGRSKLRGTGDKGEPIPPPVQIKTKNERRTSWGLSLGAKSRADESASQAEKDMMYTRPPTQPHQAPQSSQSSVVSPFGPAPQHGDPGNRLASRESYGPPPMSGPATLPSRDQEDRTEWQIPTPDNDNSTWDPFKGTDLGKDDASEHSGVQLGNREDHGQPNRGAEVPSGKPVSGDATPTLANTGGIRMVPPEVPATSSQQPTSAFATPSQPVPAGAPPQTQNEAGMPQRQSSFVGLPLIRRGSTFDVTTKPAQSKPTETITEGVSTDVDEDAAAGQHGTLTSEVTVGSTLVGTDSLIVGKDFEKDVDEPEQQTPADAPTAQQQQQQPQHQPRPPLHSQPQHPFQMHPVHQGSMPPQHPQFGPRQMVPPGMMGGNPIHRLPPSGPWKLEESHLSEPLHRVTPKPQQLPPTGQWKLEESHLAEPLHSVNRNRAGTSSSHQEPYFGYDKETGIDLPSPTSSVATSPVSKPFQHRQKPSETPPSSANRYPGLFPGQPQAQQTPKDGPPGPTPQFMRRLSNEAGITRTGTGGPEEERGRSRKASALFKDIGSRFRRGSSERRGTSVEPNPQQQQHQQQPSQSHAPEQPHLLGDGASVSSITTDEIQERKKARSSFMLGLRNRPSTDHGRQKSGDGLMGPPPRPDEARPETSPEERKLSRFGTGLGALTGHHHKSSGPLRASTSNLANEPGTSTPLPKKRFSGFNTKAAVAGVFHHRPSGDMTPKPGTPNSSRPVSSQLVLQQQASLERPEFSHPGFERSNTAGPSFGQMQQPTLANAQPLDPQERRRRRGSAAGLISGLLGHGGKHKEEHQDAPVRPPSGQHLSMQQPQQPQMQQPPMQQPQARQPSGPQVGNPQLGGPQLPRLQTQGQPQGPPQGRRPSGPQLPTPQLPGPQLGSPQLPGSHPASPQLSGPTIASPQPQRPQQYGSQQPPMLRRMTGTSSLLEQTPTSPDRPPSGGPHQKQQAQVAYQNSRPSPLGFGPSTTPGGTPPIGTTNVPSRHGTPQTPFSVGQVLSDNGSGRMRSTSPTASAVRPAPMSQGAYHNSTQSLDKLVRPGQVGGQAQQPVAGSPAMAFRPDARPANGRVENNTQDDLPLSPVSQVSNMGPPSVSSIATGQSPRLTTSGPAMGRRQSSQLSQTSQPNTPALSMASHTPPTQHQPFSTRMGMSPQQQYQQQFPPGFQPQVSNPQQGGQQNFPSQQQPGGFRGQPSPHPSSFAPGRPSMQMQHSVGPQVPPKDNLGPPPQPYAAEAPRQGSPASSKWKGLKNRMSGQAVHKPSSSQSKPEGEKLSASKILGAFKRSSKQAPAVEHSFQGGYQGGRQHQQFPGQPPYGQTPTPRQSSQFGSPPVSQMQTPRQSSQQFSSPPVGQMQTPRQSSQFTSPPMGQHQFQRPPGPIGQGQPGMGQPYPGYGFKPQGQFQSPPQPQGQFQSPQQHQGQFQSPPQVQGQFRSPPQAQGQFQSPPRPQDRFPSPPLPQGQFESPPQRQVQGQFQSPPQAQGQFQSPPQPQGQWQSQTHSPGGQFAPSPYQPGQFPTQGQGMTGQSPNRTHPSPRVQQGHMMQQSTHQQQQPITVQTSVPIQQPIPVHAPSPHQGALLQQFMPPAANNQPNNAEHQGNRGGQPSHPAFAHRGSPANTNQQGRPDMQRLVSNDSHHSGGSSGSSRLGSNPPPVVQYSSPRMVAGENEATKPLPPAGGVPVVAATAAGASPAGGQPLVAMNENSAPKTEEHRALSLSPPSGSNGEISPVNSALLSQPTPEPKGTINAAPAQNETTHDKAVSPESNGNGVATKATGGPSFSAELEDTEDARKRTLRIDSQEEKIHYDPNADSDGELPPQMSATSYPGQEWNPYGGEYGDLD